MRVVWSSAKSKGKAVKVGPSVPLCMITGDVNCPTCVLPLDLHGIKSMRGAPRADLTTREEFAIHQTMMARAVCLNQVPECKGTSGQVRWRGTPLSWLNSAPSPPWSWSTPLSFFCVWAKFSKWLCVESSWGLDFELRSHHLWKFLPAVGLQTGI